MFSLSPKSHHTFGLLFKSIWHKEISKIAQSGHTAAQILSNDILDQCDQIGRVIALWATFLWQQLFCPNSYSIFVLVSKSLIFLVKSFLGKFIEIWRLFNGHTVLDFCVNCALSFYWKTVIWQIRIREPWHSTMEAVWPDLAKFCHILKKIYIVFGNFLYWAQCSTYFGKFYMLWGNFS